MEDKSFLRLTPVLWKHKNLIIGTVLLAGLLTSLVMLLKPNYYRSYTTFYPVNSALLEPSVQINERALDYYGDDRDVDRLLTMSHSTDIANRIISEHNLADHYGININNAKGKIALLKEFKKLYQVQKTEFDAIELSIEDKEPEMATKLVTAITTYVDQKATDIVQGSKHRLLNNLKNTYASNSEFLSKISDSLGVARQEYGIYNTVSQAEALATMEVNSPGNRTLKKIIENYSAGISIVTNLEALQEELNEGLAQNGLQIQQLESSIASNTSSIHIMEQASVPIEKSRPKRSLYVIGSMLITCFFVMAIILIRENIRSLNTE